MKPLIIFEIANNHMGSLSHGKKIIKSFIVFKKKYGKYLDFAFKFQFRDIDTYIHESFLKSNHKQVRRFLDTRLNEKNWLQLINYTRKDFKIICTPFDEKSVDKIIKYKFDYLKIASCSCDEWPLLEYIAAKAKKMKIICSLGGADASTISKNFSFFEKKNINIKYLFCVAKYPSEVQNYNLAYFEHLRNVFGSKICGFSSHEDPLENLSGSIAYSMGARIFEKHVNIKSKKYSINKYSSTPSDIEDWIKNLIKTIVRVGSVKSRDDFVKYEKLNLLEFKRGAILKNKVLKKPGDMILLQDIDFKFPLIKNQVTSNEISKFSEFLVKKIIKPGEQITRNNIIIKYKRAEIEEIRDKVHLIVKRSGVVLQKKNVKLEISHHYGVKKFYNYGICMITFINDQYCKKLIFMFYNQKHPAQFHKKKQETFFILFGKIKLQIISKDNKVKTRILNSGNLVTINPGDIHEFKCLSKNGAVIEELSTKSAANDSFYLDKEINNNKDRKSFIFFNK